MQRHVVTVTSILVLLFSVFKPCSAWTGIETEKIILQLPETMEGRFLVQIYSLINERPADRLMVAGSEFQESRAKGSNVEISADFGQTFYLSESVDKGMSNEYFVRIIRSAGKFYQFKDFRTWSFQVSKNGDLLLGGCRPVENTAWKPIQLSKEFVVHWQEENPANDEDYSGNFAVIRGLPRSFLFAQPLNKKTGWRFKVSGIFYSEEGGERYDFEPIYKRNGKYELRGNSPITIKILNENNFSLKETSYRGD